jgi:uncharacterized protein YjdB
MVSTDTFINCINGGTITVKINNHTFTTNNYAAGITRYLNNQMISCFNYGLITSEQANHVGGLVGEATRNALMRDCATVGNFAIARSYVNSIATATTGLSREDFQRQETFVGLDFRNVWTMHPEANNGFPILQSMLRLYNISETPIPERPAPGNNAATAVRIQITLEVGQTLQLGAILTPADSTSNVTYATSRNEVASVNQNGLVRARARGTANITVRAGDVRQIVTIRVM